MSPPSVRVGQAWTAWQKIGASDWLVRQLRFGLQLPWTRGVPYRTPRPYRMKKEEQEFAREEISRWLSLGFVRRATPEEGQQLRRKGQVFPAFVNDTVGKQRLVVNYKRENECMESRTFRMDQISDLAAVLRPGDHLFKAHVKDAYHHLRLRPADQV